MSKERARRRAEREREAAIRAAARAAEVERRERRSARHAALARLWPVRRSSRPAGVLAERRRRRTSLLTAALVIANALLWFFTDSWATRVGAVVVSLLAAPVLFVLLFPRP